MYSHTTDDTGKPVRIRRARRYPLYDYAVWKNAGGVVTYPPILIAPSFVTNKDVADVVSYEEATNHGMQQLMLYPYVAPIYTPPVYRKNDLHKMHRADRYFFMDGFFSKVDSPAFTTLAPSFTVPADDSIPTLRPAAIVSSKFAYHPFDDTFHPVTEDVRIQTSGTPVHRRYLSFPDAPLSSSVLYDELTKEVIAVSNRYTVNYLRRTQYPAGYCVSSKAEYISLLDAIRASSGKVIRRLTDNRVLFIGSKIDALHFINYRSDGERRVAPTGFLRTLKVEDIFHASEKYRPSR